jgi:ABC-type lipopolysaccharide export system ATPase subunit
VLDSAGNPINSIESIGIGVIITAKKVRELLDLAQKDADKFIEEMDKLEKDKKKN